MDIASSAATPILTKILREESKRVATSEICESVWQNICAAIVANEDLFEE